MKIINQSDIVKYEKQKDRFNSGYLAAGYIILIAFICIVGGSLIKLMEVLTWVKS